MAGGPRGQRYIDSFRNSKSAVRLGNFFPGAETGLALSNKGLFTFATGQTFPGTGTLTGVTTASGSGLAGGGTGGTLNLALTNACAASQVLQWNGTAWACSSSRNRYPPGITAGNEDLTGGGKSGTVTLNLDTTKIPQLGAANTFTGNQTVNGNLTVLNNSTYHPFLVQSSSSFGTWLQLSNTSAGGQTWNILSAGGANSEGAGNLGITNLNGGSIFLEGPVNASGNVTVASAAPTVIGNTGCGGIYGGIGFGANSLSGCANYSLLGDTTNTYLNRPTSGQIVFRENNATEMVLASGGNVGIGNHSLLLLAACERDGPRRDWSLAGRQRNAQRRFSRQGRWTIPGCQRHRQHWRQDTPDERVHLECYGMAFCRGDSWIDSRGW